MDAAFMGAATMAADITADEALTADAATTAVAATTVKALAEPTADVLTMGARDTAEHMQEIAIAAEDT
jgi:hypothetical protein